MRKAEFAYTTPIETAPERSRFRSTRAIPPGWIEGHRA